MGACGRVWGHMAGVVAGCGGMWQGMGVFGRGSGLCHGWGYVAGVGTCGRVWGHVAGFESMWHTLSHAPTPCHMSPSMP